MKLESIEIVNDRRIMFEHNGKIYSVNITNENKLRLSVVDGILAVYPIGANCILFEEQNDCVLTQK